MFSNNIKTQKDSPYWDDFQENVEGLDKNYTKILFRPGRSVQARELTQMQTLLQSQINKFGKSVYKEGTPVIGGQCSIDNNVVRLKVGTTISDTLGITAVMANYLVNQQGILYSGVAFASATVTAKIIGTNVEDGLVYLYVKYSSAVSSSAKTFSENTIVKTDLNPTSTLQVPITTIGLASRISVNRGVYFIAGVFVENVDQSIFVKHDASPNVNITGFALFSVIQSVATSITDNTLLDNSAGTSNYTAPGADRHKIDLVLEFNSSTTVAGKEYIQLLKIDAGKVFIAQRTEYSKLDDLLAQRTHEESGNYTVNPFLIDIKEKSKALDPLRGISNVATDIDNFIVGVEPGIAYVDGYRVQLQERQDITVAKPRTEASDVFSSTLSSFSINYGSYIIGTIDSASTILPSVQTRRAVYALLSDNSTIAEANLIGLCYVTSVEYHSSDQVRVFISDVNLKGIRTFGEAKYLKLTTIADGSLSGTSASAVINTTLIFTLNKAAAATAFTLFDSDLNTLVFPLPYVGVKSLLSNSQNLAFSYTARMRFDVSYSSPTSILITTTFGQFTSNTANDYIVYRTNGTKAQLYPSSITPNGATVTLTFPPNTLISSDTFNVITHILITNPGSTVRTKTLTAGQTVFGINDFNSGNAGTAGAGSTASGITAVSSLALPSDIAKIVRIRRTPASGTTLVEQTDFENYVLDSGQRDTHYTTGSIRYIGAYATIAAGIVIDYLYFSHDQSNANDYFIRDSYVQSPVIINGVTYSSADVIPSYQGNNLSDCVDFRRSQVIPSATSGAYLEPNSIITTAVQVWMPRIDVLVVDKNSQFKVIQGKTSIAPIAPAIPVHSMALYTFNIPGYVTSVKDIGVFMIDNQRYTMRDIGELETRIYNLEYYTSLSLLESQTIQKSILNTTGGERFKNGFFADGFIGSNMGNSDYPGYLCAIDGENHILRPFFTMTDGRVILHSSQDSTKLSSTLITDSTHIRLTSDLLTLPYSEVILIDQPYASQPVNVNPYTVFTWDGNLELSPSSDNWIETAEVNIINNDTGLYDAAVKILTILGKLGSVWNAWTWGKWSKTQRTGTRSQTTTTLTFTDQKSTSTSVTTSIIPFIRSRKVHFKATLLKPNTQVYAFFDNVNISNFAKQEGSDIVKFGANTNPIQLYTNLSAHPDNASAILTSDLNGTLIGNFIIPNNSTTVFKTGNRIFKLCDSQTNGKGGPTDKIETYAEAVYSTSGILNTTRNQITTTRVIGDLKRETTATESKTEYRDPLAQSFMIGNIPSGCFITSVDLFFEAKDSQVPVTLHIVECSNGTPTQNRIPGSEVSLNPTSINISLTAASATRFTFKTPIYLKSGIEYAMVIMSMSNNYNIWVAQVGEFDITTMAPNVKNRITSNPYAGVFFMSSNSSTWTADQTKDLKFKMHRAKFKTLADENAVEPAGPVGISVELKSINNKNADNVEIVDAASLIHLSTQELNFPDTSLTWTIKFGSDTAMPIRSNDNYTLPVLKTFNSSNLVICTATLKTTSEYVSPVIDLERLSLRKVRNEINAFEINSTGTVGAQFTDTTALSDVGILAAKSRYVTPIIQLNNPADQLNIYMDISLPNYTDVRVYAKLRTSTADYDSIVWEPVSLMPGTAIPFTDDQEEFNEVRFAILDTGLATTRSFNAFMVKIEMLANDVPTLTSISRFTPTTLTPLIKNLRIIAST